jgi:hypothetical protein
VSDEPVAVRRSRHRNPDLVFHVDVTLTENEGRWLETAMLADWPDIGTGTDPGRRDRPGGAGPAAASAELSP